MADILELLKTSKKRLFVGLAGPGTGKTYTFRKIIESNEYKNKQILILSFINKLINDLQEDFENCKNVTVSTLHAFARQQIGDVDFDEDLDKIISEDFFYITGKAVDYEKKFFEDKLEPDEFSFYKGRKNFYKNQKSLYSFNSIVYALNRHFEKNPGKIPGNYDLVLIDEFQDFNKSEYELIKLLNRKSRVVVVGDDDQSLYCGLKDAVPNQIRSLYRDKNAEQFSIDYCFRCTSVIVNAVNDLITNAKNSGFLRDRINEKKFLYPTGVKPEKDLVSNNFDKIDFIPAVCGDKLMYELSKAIKNDVKEERSRREKNNDKENSIRILIITPSYFKKTIYEGLLKNGLNVVEFELFSDEKTNKMKHKKIINLFRTLSTRKTDNLSLRNLLPLYLEDDDIKDLIVKSHKLADKKIWLCLDPKIQKQIEKDISIFKKVKKNSKKLEEKELIRFSKVFNTKNVLSKLIHGFDSVSKNAIEVEITTLMSSKGLSADFVYYVGVDDKEILDKKTNKFTNQKICEFLVGLTRAKEKLTLISMQDKNPKILDFLDKSYIKTINV
jgi:superfamily I DNA/RNA helicase